MNEYRTDTITFSEEEMSDIDTYKGPDITTTTQLRPFYEMSIKRHSSQSNYARGWDLIFGKHNE